MKARRTFSPGPGRSLLSALLGAALLCTVLPIGAQEWGLAPLLEAFAQHHSGHAHFVEKRTVALLDAPLLSSGELSFSAPDKLVKHTLQPREELLELEGSTVHLERGNQHLTVDLADHPEFGALVESIRATLNGKREVLEHNYTLTLSGAAAKWTLLLVPKDTRVLAVVSRITLTGSADQLQTIEYVQADGDRSLMTVDASSTP